MIVCEMPLVKIMLKKESQELYTLYRQEGWYGYIVDGDKDHMFLKRFGVDTNRHIYFGFMERIVNSDVEKIIKINT